LSSRFATSPAIDLTLGESRLRVVLHRALCVVCAYALWLIYARGYGAVSAFLGLIVVYLLSRLRRDPMVGARLHWRQGCWSLERAGVRRAIVPSNRSTLTPWVIYLVFCDQPAGPGGHLWLYADCAPGPQLRRLRVRLVLECGVRAG
jgi:hypothetical protein